jgi:hypothetical protein
MFSLPRSKRKGLPVFQTVSIDLCLSFLVEFSKANTNKSLTFRRADDNFFVINGSIKGSNPIAIPNTETGVIGDHKTQGIAIQLVWCYQKHTT